MVFVDDVLKTDGIFSAQTISSPRDGGLFVGGVSTVLHQAALKRGEIKTVEGLVGAIKDIAFIDES